MMLARTFAATAFASLFALAAAGCGSSESEETTLYQRLGEEAGIRSVIVDFVGRVLADPAINGYFLNASVSGDRVVDCLVKQVGNATGGPQVYPDPAAGCRDMKASHEGLGISQADFDDLVTHLAAALGAAGVAAGDIETIAGVLLPMAADIVEDPDNDATVYQRVGRKPAIAAVISAFIAEVVADDRINGFFTETNADRLHTCLVRQVCSIDGPCDYGAEVDHPSDPGVGADLPCRDMVSSHEGIVDDASQPITVADFDALVEGLVNVLDGTAVSAGDKTALLTVLGSMCAEIVSDPANCP